MMTQQDMVDLVAENAGINKLKAKEALDVLFRAIAHNIALSPDGVRLPELGSLRRVAREGRRGVNPPANPCRSRPATTRNSPPAPP